MADLDEIIKYSKELTILFVDDNKEIQEAVILLLEDLFKEVIIANNGEDGLEKFKENQDKINLIITDINMPKMNGLEMSKEIKKIKYKIPIIILTALTDIDTLKEAIDIGIDSFINKPLDNLDILFEKLEIIITKINYDTMKQEKEKAKFLLEIMNHISHHWRQPLNVISTITSVYSLKLENDICLTKEDIANIDKITDEVQLLSEMITKLQNLDFEKASIEDIKKIAYISDKIYR